MASGDYFVLEDVREMAEIPKSDRRDDKMINKFGNHVNQKVDDDLKDVANVVPLDSADISDSVKMLANQLTVSLYKGWKGDEAMAKYWEGRYDSDLATIKRKFKVTPTSRTKGVVYASSYATDNAKNNDVGTGTS